MPNEMKCPHCGKLKGKRCPNCGHQLGWCWNDQYRVSVACPSDKCGIRGPFAGNGDEGEALRLFTEHCTHGERPAIDARLPRTQDGVPIYPDMQVWFLEQSSVGNTTAAVGPHSVVTIGKVGCYVRTSCCEQTCKLHRELFSTREAAEESRKKGGVTG